MQASSQYLLHMLYCSEVGGHRGTYSHSMHMMHAYHNCAPTYMHCRVCRCNSC